MVDPAVFRVACQDTACALGVSGDDFAIVAGGDDAAVVGHRCEDRPAMGADPARLAVGRRKDDRFFAENVSGGAAKKMRADDAAVDRDRPGAFDDRNCVAAACRHRLSFVALFRDAALKTFSDHLARQVAADEDDPALAFFILIPWPLTIAIEDHVNPLEDEARIVIFERKNALAAQNVRPFFLHQVLNPGKELVGIERLFGVERNRLHLLIVIVLEPAMRMRVDVVMVMMMAVLMVMVVIMAMFVMMIVIVAAEEVRLQ